MGKMTLGEKLDLLIYKKEQMEIKTEDLKWKLFHIEKRIYKVCLKLEKEDKELCINV